MIKILLILFSFLLGATPSFAKDDNPLLGTWVSEASASASGGVMVFEPKGVLVMTPDGVPSVSGKYSVKKGGWVDMDMTSVNMGVATLNYVFESPDTVVFSYPNGVRQTFKRKQSTGK